VNREQTNTAAVTPRGGRRSGMRPCHIAMSFSRADRIDGDAICPPPARVHSVTNAMQCNKESKKGMME